MTSIIPFPTETRTLPNGLTVIVVPMPSDGLVAYWSIVRTGSRDEYEEGRSGFAHFFEHMMFRGTERYPADAYSRIITTIGADANAYTTDDHTAYHLSMAAEDLEQVMELESDRFQHLSYPEAAFQTEAFERHPYGHTTLGYERDIAIMPTLYDYSRTFFKRYYRPENTVLFIAGDVTPAKTFSLAEKHYAGWERGYVPPQIVTEPEQTAERRIEVGYDGQTLPLLLIAYKLPVYDPADRTRVAADLFADLAFGETSEAYRQLVLDEQVVEDLDAGASYNRDPGLLEITARIKDATKIDHVLAVIDAAVTKYRSTQPDARRLTDLQRRLHYGFLMGLQTPDSVAARVAPFVALHGDLRGLDRLYATYAEITPADVHAAADRYLHSSRRTVGVLKSRS
jgi:zinc protease